MPKQQVISSWRSSMDGSLVEQDLRVTYCAEEGSYLMEASQEAMGISLGVDPLNAQHTVISEITNPQKLSKFLQLICIGDLLVSINDKQVVEEGLDSIANILETLAAAGHVRKLKFLNRKKMSLSVFLRRLELKDQMTDLLGFVISMDDYLEEERRRTIAGSSTQQRDRDWVEYLKAIGGIQNLKPAGFFKPSDDLKFMVRRGIPVAYRAAIWKKISLSCLLQQHYPLKYYQSLLARVDEIPKKVAEDIEKDVDRTFPQHVYFRYSGQGLVSLRRVLQAFALHNPSIGYCQSLNFIVGMMLIFMDEEDSFFLLVTVVEQLLPPDYYTKSMVGTYVDQFVLAHIIKKFLPKINTTLESNNLQLPLITVQWFMCIFVNTLRPEVTLRVWDMFLNEGNKVLFRIATALFKLHETKLMAVKDAGDLFNTLRSIGADMTDPELLISTAYKSYVPSSSRATMRNILRNPRCSAAATMKIVTATNISPRLHPMTANGAVPKDLLGLGLAHLGPADALEKYNAGSIKTTSASEVKKHQESVTPVETIDTELIGDSSSLAQNLDKLVVSPNPESEEDAVDQCDPTFADPSLLFHNVGDLADEFVAKNNSIAHKKKLERRRKKARNGQFAFYRADIALWRSSFRPGLEERYNKMEMARASWQRKSNLNKSLNGDQSSKFTPLVAVVEEENEDLKPRSSDGGATDPPELTTNVRRLSRKDFLRRSLGSSSQEENVLDTSDLKYNIDHAFVNAEAKDPNNGLVK